MNPGQWSKTGKDWFQNWKIRPMRRSLSSKMLAAYGVAFGISFVGMGFGFTWARQVEGKAQAAQLEVIEDLEDVHHFQSSTDRLLIHHLAIANWLRNSSELSRPKLMMVLSDLRQDYTGFQKSWDELLASDEFGGQEEDERIQDIGPTNSESAIAERLTREYKPDVETYLNDLQLFFSILDSALPRPETAFLEEHLSRLNQSKLLRRIDGFTHEVSALINATEEEQDEAQELYASANRLQHGIIYGSAAFSGVLGLSLIFLITQSLMQPLKKMTHLTQKSIEEGTLTSRYPLIVPMRWAFLRRRLMRTRYSHRSY
ncbi:MAG: hypothetical protein AAF889_06020 [Cyanobacteria bacterium P01_D01_bin.73]